MAVIGAREAPLRSTGKSVGETTRGLIACGVRDIRRGGETHDRCTHLGAPLVVTAARL